YLSEVFDEQRAFLSDHICTALQLANFWQDVARDFAIGRVYLPEEDRQRFGYGDVDLAAQRFTPAFGALLRFEVDRTRDLFYRGIPLVELVPDAVQADVELFIPVGRPAGINPAARSFSGSRCGVTHESGATSRAATCPVARILRGPGPAGSKELLPCLPPAATRPAPRHVCPVCLHAHR